MPRSSLCFVYNVLCFATFLPGRISSLPHSIGRGQILDGFIVDTQDLSQAPGNGNVKSFTSMETIPFGFDRVLKSPKQ